MLIPLPPSSPDPKKKGKKRPVAQPKPEAKPPRKKVSETLTQTLRDAGEKKIADLLDRRAPVRPTQGPPAPRLSPVKGAPVITQADLDATRRGNPSRDASMDFATNYGRAVPKSSGGDSTVKLGANKGARKAYRGLQVALGAALTPGLVAGAKAKGVKDKDIARSLERVGTVATNLTGIGEDPIESATNLILGAGFPVVGAAARGAVRGLAKSAAKEGGVIARKALAGLERVGGNAVSREIDPSVKAALFNRGVLRGDSAAIAAGRAPVTRIVKKIRDVEPAIKAAFANVDDRSAVAKAAKAEISAIRNVAKATGRGVDDVARERLAGGTSGGASHSVAARLARDLGGVGSEKGAVYTEGKGRSIIAGLLKPDAGTPLHEAQHLRDVGKGLTVRELEARAGQASVSGVDGAPSLGRPANLRPLFEAAEPLADDLSDDEWNRWTTWKAYRAAPYSDEKMSRLDLATKYVDDLDELDYLRETYHPGGANLTDAAIAEDDWNLPLIRRALNIADDETVTDDELNTLWRKWVSDGDDEKIRVGELSKSDNSDLDIIRYALGNGYGIRHVRPEGRFHPDTVWRRHKNGQWYPDMRPGTRLIRIPWDSLNNGNAGMYDDNLVAQRIYDWGQSHQWSRHSDNARYGVSANYNAVGTSKLKGAKRLDEMMVEGEYLPWPLVKAYYEANAPLEPKTVRRMVADQLGRSMGLVGEEAELAGLIRHYRRMDDGDKLKGAVANDIRRLARRIDRENGDAWVEKTLRAKHTDDLAFDGVDAFRPLDTGRAARAKANAEVYRAAEQSIAKGVDPGEVLRSMPGGASSLRNRRAVARLAAEAGRPVATETVTLPNGQVSVQAYVYGDAVTIPAEMVDDVAAWGAANMGQWLSEKRLIDVVMGRDHDIRAWLEYNRADGVTALIREREAWLRRMRNEPAVSWLVDDKEASDLVMQYGERRIVDGKPNADDDMALEVLKRLRPDDWQRYVEADQWFRAAYDDLLARQNDVRTRFGLDPIRPRKNYYRHVREEASKWETMKSVLGFDKGGTTQTEIVRWSAAKGKTAYSSNELRRKGDKTVFDALGNFDQFLSSVVAQIHLTEPTMRRRALADYLEREAGRLNETGQAEKRVAQLMHLAQLMNDHASALSGDKGSLDVALERMAEGSRLGWLPSTVQWLMGWNARARLIGNVRTVLMQAGQLPMAFTRISPGHLVAGLLDEATHAIEGTGKVSTPFLIRRYNSVEPVRGLEGVDKVTNFIARKVVPMEPFEELVVRGIHQGTMRQGRAKGLSGDALVKYADDLTERICQGRATGEKPPIYNSKTMTAFLQYTIESANHLSGIFIDLRRDPDPTKKLAKLAFYTYLANLVYEETLGDTPIPLDPIGMILGHDPTRWFERGPYKPGRMGDLVDAVVLPMTDKGGALRRALNIGGRVAGEAVSGVPGSTLAASLLPEFSVAGSGLKRENILGGQEAGAFAGGPPITATVRDIAGSGWMGAILANFIPAGGQIRKTIKAGDSVTGGIISNKLPAKGDSWLADSVRSFVMSPSIDPKTGKDRWDNTKLPVAEKVKALIFGAGVTGPGSAYRRDDRLKEIGVDPKVLTGLPKKKPNRRSTVDPDETPAERRLRKLLSD